jgi:crotonobetainyl-CoA:carnitine CoA-transferase CaiB-like acyl-CoA transferase
MAMHAPTMPLAGIRILDLTVMTAGPVGTMVLADLGADVIKVEEIGQGDLSRNLGTVFVAGEAAQFLSQNRNKRSLRLDLKHPQGRAAFLRLAAGCDVVAENFRPGTLDRLGVGYADVRKVRPDIIFVSVSAFGQDGPYAHLPANDPIVQALSGLMAMTGEAGGPPARIGNPYPDFGGAMLLAFGIVTALLHRMRTGQGQRVSTSLLDGAVFSSIPRDGETLITGAAPPRLGSAHPTFVPYQNFRAQDGLWFFLSCFTEKFWHSLCDALDEPGWRADPRFACNRDRCANRNVLIPLLEARFAAAPRAVWLDRLARYQVPAAPIQDLHQALREDPQLRYNGTLVVQEHPTAGRIETLAAPIRMQATPACYRRPPPRFGEHSEQVLREFGFAADEIAALLELGVVRGMYQPDSEATDTPLPTGAGAIARAD